LSRVYIVLFVVVWGGSSSAAADVVTRSEIDERVRQCIYNEVVDRGGKKKPNAQSENGTKAKEEEEEELAGRLWW
jgi:hypothetical protein